MGKEKLPSSSASTRQTRFSVDLGNIFLLKQFLALASWVQHHVQFVLQQIHSSDNRFF